jgi:hypothetical protein
MAAETHETEGGKTTVEGEGKKDGIILHEMSFSLFS